MNFPNAVFDRIDDVTKALESGEVDGMLLDFYTADYYRQKGKFKSLLTVLEFANEVDVVMRFRKNMSNIMNCCFNWDNETNQDDLEVMYFFLLLSNQPAI